MASYSGRGGIIKVGTAVVAEVEDWTLETSVAIRFITSCGDESVKRAADGLKDSKGGLSARFDDTDTNGQQALLEGASPTLKLYPAGDSSGRQFITVPAVIPSNDIASGINSESTTVNITFEGNGDITRGTV